MSKLNAVRFKKKIKIYIYKKKVKNCTFVYVL